VVALLSFFDCAISACRSQAKWLGPMKNSVGQYFSPPKQQCYHHPLPLQEQTHNLHTTYTHLEIQDHNATVTPAINATNKHILLLPALQRTGAAPLLESKIGDILSWN
jgi:hypothetical protein